MTAPLAGAADAPVVAAKPTPAAVKPATMIFRIVMPPLLEVGFPAPIQFRSQPQYASPSVFTLTFRNSIFAALCPSRRKSSAQILTFRRVFHLSVVHLFAVSRNPK
jgi:hypothetical protein